MGTNYYLHENVCPHCGRAENIFHIGKSSVGWCFGLHVDEEIGVKDLSDWTSRFRLPNSEIRNEYGDKISIEKMLQTITGREWKTTTGNRWSKQDYRANHAEPGPNGLVRHAIDGSHCVGHGAGTWDHITGQFS